MKSLILSPFFLAMNTRSSDENNKRKLEAGASPNKNRQSQNLNHIPLRTKPNNATTPFPKPTQTQKNLKPRIPLSAFLSPKNATTPVPNRSHLRSVNAFFFIYVFFIITHKTCF